MKKYNCNKIKELANENVDTITLGMQEDWSWTAECVYKNEKFNINLSGNTIAISGISGSTWATPIAEIQYKDSTTKIVEVWEDDGNSESADFIAQSKMFAAMTGGMDYKN